jgi:hypothetical protein
MVDKNKYLTASNFSASCFNIAFNTFGTIVSNSRLGWVLGTGTEEGGTGGISNPDCKMNYIDLFQIINIFKCLYVYLYVCT